MSELVTCQIGDQVATIIMQNGQMNAISHQVINALNLALDQVQQAQVVVVLTG